MRGVVMALQRTDFAVAQCLADAAIGIVDVVGQDETVSDGAGHIAHARGGAIGGWAIGAGRRNDQCGAGVGRIHAGRNFQRRLLLGRLPGFFGTEDAAAGK